MTTKHEARSTHRPRWVRWGTAVMMIAAAPVAAAQSAETSAAPTVAMLAPATSAKTVAASGPATPLEWRARQGLYYKRNWGVEVIGVKTVSSGYMLAFKYLIVDAEKAKLLNDRKTRAFLRDEASGTVLSVPAMEKVGELRPGATPEAGRAYFMIFGNPGRLVKPGNRVSVVAGGLSIDGMIVE